MRTIYGHYASPSETRYMYIIVDAKERRAKTYAASQVRLADLQYEEKGTREQFGGIDEKIMHQKYT